MDWIYLVYDYRNQWLALLNTVINNMVSYKAGSFLTGRAGTSTRPAFSRCLLRNVIGVDIVETLSQRSLQWTVLSRKDSEVDTRELPCVDMLSPLSLCPLLSASNK